MIYSPTGRDKNWQKRTHLTCDKVTKLSTNLMTMIAQRIERRPFKPKVVDSTSTQLRLTPHQHQGSRIKNQGSKVSRFKVARSKDARLTLVAFPAIGNALEQVTFSFSEPELFRLPAWEGAIYG